MRLAFRDINDSQLTCSPSTPGVNPLLLISRQMIRPPQRRPGFAFLRAWEYSSSGVVPYSTSAEVLCD